MRRIASIVLPLVAATLAPMLLAGPALAAVPSVSTFASGQPNVWALAFNAHGDLFVARRTPSNVILKCTPPLNTMTLFASGFADPTGLVCDAAGNLYVANYNYGAAGGGVSKVTPGGAVIPFAALPNPVSLAIDGAGNLYVGRWDRTLNRITPTGVVSVYADFDTVTYLGVNSANNHLTALHMTADGTLYAAVSWGALFRIAPGGSPITPVGRPSIACEGLTSVGDYGLFYSSFTQDEIWSVSSGGASTLYSGATNAAGLVNGPAPSARFNNPAGLAWGPGGLFVADYGNSAIRVFDAATPAARSSWGRLKSLYR